MTVDEQLRQAREEQDGFAAALCWYAHPETWRQWPHADQGDRARIALSDPAECLKARDAEKDRRISELEDYCGRAALAIAKSDDDEAYHQLYCAIVRDLTLSAERQAARMNQAMGLTGEQSKAVLSMMREEIAQEKK